jgi:hypothetical protein
MIMKLSELFSKNQIFYSRKSVSVFAVSEEFSCIPLNKISSRLSIAPYNYLN